MTENRERNEAFIEHLMSAPPRPAGTVEEAKRFFKALKNIMKEMEADDEPDAPYF